MSKCHAANYITASRMLFALLLLFFSAHSVWFLVLYLLCGLTDMIDGIVARKTDSVTAFGAKLDTVADFVFLLTACVKLLPIMKIPAWIWFWIGVITVIKLCSEILGFLLRGRLAVEHTIMNKLTGGLLFLHPLTLSHIELQYSGAFVCVFATIAAVQEGCYIRIGREV